MRTYVWISRPDCNPMTSWPRELRTPNLDKDQNSDDNGFVQKRAEQWLEEVAPEKKQGIFKLFLGYAPGVGKTYSMLSEGIRRYSRGEDVVVGVIETHGRKAVAELAAKLETVPRKQIDYKGTVFTEMDVDAILARKPAVVLVDELEIGRASCRER